MWSAFVRRHSHNCCSWVIPNAACLRPICQPQSVACLVGSRLVWIDPLLPLSDGVGMNCRGAGCPQRSPPVPDLGLWRPLGNNVIEKSSTSWAYQLNDFKNTRAEPVPVCLCPLAEPVPCAFTGILIRKVNYLPSINSAWYTQRIILLQTVKLGWSTAYCPPIIHRVRSARVIRR